MTKSSFEMIKRCMLANDGMSNTTLNLPFINSITHMTPEDLELIDKYNRSLEEAHALAYEYMVAWTTTLDIGGIPILSVKDTVYRDSRELIK